jgi:O-antigen/teichoic acid export membrane protein
MGIIIRQSFKATIVNYIGMLLGAFNVVFLFPLVLTSTQIGLLGLLIDVALLFSSFAQLGVSFTMVKFFPYFKDAGKKHNGFFFLTIAQSLIGFFITALIVLIFRDEIVSKYSNSPLFIEYFNWIFPLTFFTLFLIYFETVSSLTNRIVIPKLIREVMMRVLVISSLILFYFDLIEFHLLVVLQIGIYLIALVANFLYARKRIEISLKPDFRLITKSFRREIALFTTYTGISTWCGIIVASVVSLVLGSQEGLSSNGIWRITLFVALFIDSPHRAIISVTTPILAESLSNKDFVKVKDIATRTSAIQFLISSLIYLLVVSNIDNLFSVMPNGEEYRIGGSVIILVGAAKLVEMISGLNSSILTFKYFRFGLFFSIVVALVSVSTNLYFIPRFSITGAAIATLLTTVVVHGIMHLFLAWRFKFTPLNKGILHTLFLMLALFGLNWFIPQMGHPIIDTALRCLILGMLYISLVYRLKISKEINEQISNLLETVISKFRK